MTLVINLFGGPGTGKSTMMADVFSKLKWKGINCEMAPEFAKEKVWEESYHTLDNQIYVFGKQHHTIHRLLDKVDVIITDSPLLLSLYYGKNMSKQFHELVWQEHAKLDTINFFLKRKKKYNPSGRMQSEKAAKLIDKELKDILFKEVFLSYDAVPETADEIVMIIEDQLKLMGMK